MLDHLQKDLTFVSTSKTYKPKTYSLTDRCGTLDHLSFFFFEIIQTQDIGDGEGRSGKQHLQKELTFVSTSEAYKPKTHSLGKYQFD